LTAAEGQPVEIIGGGLAGLGLGLALRQAGLPATVFEAHGYPRHRVCGEFLTGLDAATIARLRLGPLLVDARRHRRVVWCDRDRPTHAQTLPAPALGLSRRLLDARLAEAFVAAGGALREHARVAPDPAVAGRVLALGRRRRPSPWLGLKVHARGLALAGDLELHLGDRAYVGLSAVEDDRVNVCGLFHRRAAGAEAPAAAGCAVLLRYLEAAGMPALARRLASADIDEASFCAVAAISFRREAPTPGCLRLGDHFAMPPPFTGNGMAMALQGAVLAVDPLVAWHRGELDWMAAADQVNRGLRRRFRVRLTAANALHPFLLAARPLRWLALAGRARMLPLRPLYDLTH